MNKAWGYTVTTTGLIAFVFFLKYKGTAIPLKELWFVLSFFIVAGGVYFLVEHKWQNQQLREVDDGRMNQIKNLRLTGDKIKVTPGNCEVKTRAFRKEIADGNFPSRIEMPDALYNSNRNYKTQEVEQAYIIFCKQYGDVIYKFISQATAQSAGTLKRYMDSRGGVDLYIDKRNHAIYYFDLPFL